MITEFLLLSKGIRKEKLQTVIRGSLDAQCAAHRKCLFLSDNVCSCCFSCSQASWIHGERETHLPYGQRSHQHVWHNQQEHRLRGRVHPRGCDKGSVDETTLPTVLHNSSWPAPEPPDPRESSFFFVLCPADFLEQTQTLARALASLALLHLHPQYLC